MTAEDWRERAEAEAERLWPVKGVYRGFMDGPAIAEQSRDSFIVGVKWTLEQCRELLEAAEAYRERYKEIAPPGAPNRASSIREYSDAINRLLAAAAALPGESNGRS